MVLILNYWGFYSNTKNVIKIYTSTYHVTRCYEQYLMFTGNRYQAGSFRKDNNLIGTISSKYRTFFHMLFYIVYNEWLKMVINSTVLHLDTQVCAGLGLIIATTGKSPTMSHDNQLQHTRMK